MKTLTLPPYLSTLWSNVLTMHWDGSNMHIKLKDHTTISIPNLSHTQASTLLIEHSKNHQTPTLSLPALFTGEEIALPPNFLEQAQEIARLLSGPRSETPPKEVAPEEEISKEDLSFRVWDVHDDGNKVYTVTNPLNRDESYRVHLGSPICCTCGQDRCEHIEHVLKT